jgi:uncharacterized protein DUF4145
MQPLKATWQNPVEVLAQSYRCGYCGREVASSKGFPTNDNSVVITVCPMCNRPTFFDRSYGSQLKVPGDKPGGEVKNLPPEVDALYVEARAAMSANASTVAVLGFRKLLMHVAVQKGAKEGDTFQNYVTHLEEQHHLPVGAKEWVDHIRTRGNEANHEIKMMNADDAQELLVFAEMLLKLVYEFPSRLPAKRS